MKRPLIVVSILALCGCETLPPKFDPEGCDKVSESTKRVGSDLIVDGDAFCENTKGDCDLTVAQVIKPFANVVSRQTIRLHVLRAEADAYDRELQERHEITMCFPAELWWPTEGHNRARYYLGREADGRFRIVFYPRRSTRD